MIKDIIVTLGLGDRDPAGDYAVSIAAQMDAHVTGIAFAYDPVIPGSVMGGIPPEFIESQRRESEKLATAAIEHFNKAASRAGISSEAHMIHSGLSGAADRIAKMARRFDLAICGQPQPDRPGADGVLDEALLFGAGRPVIVVPYIQKQDAKLGRVMVCWDGSRAATRAIADSMPLLKKAKQVDIVMVASGRGKEDEVPGADLGQHLARHGLKVDVKRITATDVDTTSTILSFAADSGADLIVMGGYGHSRLREFVLGGVTRGILASMTVPTLMSH